MSSAKDRVAAILAKRGIKSNVISVKEETVTPQTVAEEKVVEEKVLEEEVVEETVEEKVAEEKVAEETVAEEKVLEQTVPEEKVVKTSANTDVDIVELDSYENIKFKGILIYVNKDNEKIVLENVNNMRSRLNSKLPIEIWYKKSTLSSEFFEKIYKFENITMNSLEQFYKDEQLNKLSNEGLKWLSLQYSEFQETIIVNDDVLLYNDLKFLYELHFYSETGIVLFPSLNQPYNIIEEYKNFVKSFINENKYNYVPIEQKYVVGKEDSTNTLSQREYYNDNGVILINRTKHGKMLNNIYNYVLENKETNDYYLSQLIWLNAVKENLELYISDIPQVTLSIDNSLFETSVHKTNVNFIHIHACYSKNGYVNFDLVKFLEEATKQKYEAKMYEYRSKMLEGYRKGVEELIREEMNKFNMRRPYESENIVGDILNINDDNNEEQDINTIISQTDCSKQLAQEIYIKCNRDIVDSIMEIHDLNEKMLNETNENKDTPQVEQNDNITIKLNED